jgi:hypothetical protein
MQTPEFTDAAFRRSHGRAPRGRGSWAFQVSTTARAFDADCVGEVWFAPGSVTFAEARRAAAVHFAGATFVAVCP